MYSLNGVMFDASVQKQFIYLFCQSLETFVKKQENKFFPALIASPSYDALPKPKKRKELTKNAISGVLLIDKNSMSNECNGHFTKAGYSDLILKHFHWILSCENPIQVTWCIIMILYVSDDAKRIVARNTHPDIAREYLSSLDTRLEVFLCGELTHIKKDKKSTLSKQAKSPFEIVLFEWMTVKKLYMCFSW